MAAIRALLNPANSIDKTERRDREERSMTPALSRLQTHSSSPLSPSFPSPLLHRGISPSGSPRKKAKICKDAPVFQRGPTRGAVRYPPFVYDDETLKEYHEQFDVYPPEGEIRDYPRRIPYNSERRIFADKTGRDYFEVFQYEFKVPGREEKPYTMLWDYNVGLVRTTPLFKCCGYGKTTPAKMLNRNVGLREVCHSITGGALVAQGYWMPYEAAKAVAATFCWSIRYALTPVFGVDFIDMCVPPDSDKFGVMMIDSKITKLCTEQAIEYRRLELENPSSRPASVMPSPRTPPTPTFRRPLAAAPRFKAINDSASSGYSTETSQDDAYLLSPTSPAPYFRNVWTTGNTPRSAPRFDETPSPKTLIPRIKARRDRDEEDEFDRRDSRSSKRSSPALSPKSRREDLRKMEIDEDYDGDGDSSEMDGDKYGRREEAVSLRFHAGEEGSKDTAKDGMEFGEKEAAKALLSLWGVRKVLKRRASA